MKRWNMRISNLVTTNNSKLELSTPFDLALKIMKIEILYKIKKI